MQIVEKVKQSVTRFLPRQLRKSSVWEQRMALVVFVVLCSSISGWTIHRALKTAAALPLPTSIRVPRHGDDHAPFSVPSLHREYQAARFYTHYLEELKQTNPFKRDSLIRLRPLLLDSALRLIALYGQKDSVFK